jgi:hypothetical protein
MDHNREFRDAIGLFKTLPNLFRLGIVESYESAGESITVRDVVTDVVYYDISLRSVINQDEQKIVLIPALGSFVIIGLVNERVILIQYSKIKEVKGQIGLLKFEMSADGIQIGRNGADLKEVLCGLFDKLTISFAAIQGVIGVPVNAPEYEILKNKLKIIFK